MDDEALAARGDQRVDGRLHLVLVERRQHVAARVHALVDLEPQLARDQRLERAGHAVGLRPRAAAELEGVAEAARGDQPDLGDLALEHGVGRRRRAVDDEVEIGGRHPGGGNAPQARPTAWFGRRRRHLGESDRRRRRAAPRNQEIGERPADIDPGDPSRRSGGRRAPLRRRVTQTRRTGRAREAGRPRGFIERRRWFACEMLGCRRRARNRSAFRGFVCSSAIAYLEPS